MTTEKRFGLIGWPVAHSESPALFRRAYGGRFGYDLIETPDFEDAWTAFTEGPCTAVNVTAPFKQQAFERAAGLADAGGHPELISEAVRRIGACNILVKTPDGIAAWNSDYLAVKSIITDAMKGFRNSPTIAVIGYGGAGKAAVAAAQDCAGGVRLYRHGGISGGIKADIIIYTLPRACEGYDRLECSVLLEANYKDPCLEGHEGYIPGKEWLLRQAITGYPLMTGKIPEGLLPR